uniref:Interleukin enhancer binding factor 3a n=1 Tax=Iconisemion striatum TaxID=60296 RepID=A0A1A7XCP9_9TELE
MAAAAMWDEQQAYEELLYWDGVIQQGHRLLPEDFDRYEELRYWYDCLCYEEELRQYHHFVASVDNINDERYAEESEAFRKPSGPQDRIVMAKHAEVYPSAEELEVVQTIVSHVECALKKVSDGMEKNKGETNKTGSKKERTLCGVMRIGLVAKGLILKGDQDLDLVLLCSSWPTVDLLNQVAERLLEQLEEISAGTYTVSPSPEAAAVFVKCTKESAMTLSIHLTSPSVRTEQTNEPAEEKETQTVDGPPDVLDRQKCLSALASLRHAKWFQAKVSSDVSVVVVIRIMRDLCTRVPSWTPLLGWPLELLVEKVIGTAERKMKASESFRRVLECIASGFLMEDAPGIKDPCEKEDVDAAAGLTTQQRENITQSAQLALRLCAFGQMHKVLGLDRKPLQPRRPMGAYGRHRSAQIPPTSHSSLPARSFPFEAERDDRESSRKRRTERISESEESLPKKLCQ